jgi:Protein of unknown function (DUF2470)/Pyridoxamine 5'-phosphate oxidase
MAMSNPQTEITRLSNLIKDGIAPGLAGINMQPLTCPGGEVLVIRVPKNWNKPHMVTFNRVNKFYGRTNTEKQLMNVEQIGRAFSEQRELSETIERWRFHRAELAARSRLRHQLSYERRSQMEFDWTQGALAEGLRRYNAGEYFAAHEAWEPVSEDDVAAVRERYLPRHENSRYWVNLSDFSFFRLQPIDLYYVGGFGVMGWVESQDYEHAAPDPLAEAAPGILAHMNADHVDSMILLARSNARLEATEATMTSVDRLGFSLRLTTNEGIKGVRINFLREVATSQQTRTVLVEMVRQAKARG